MNVRKQNATEKKLLEILNKVCAQVEYGNNKFKLVWSIADDGDFTVSLDNRTPWEKKGIPNRVQNKLELDEGIVKVQPGIAWEEPGTLEIFIAMNDLGQSPVVQQMLNQKSFGEKASALFGSLFSSCNPSACLSKKDDTDQEYKKIISP